MKSLTLIIGILLMIWGFGPGTETITQNMLGAIGVILVTIWAKSVEYKL